MNLFALLAGLEYSAELKDIEVANLVRDSRLVEPGDLFFAIPGFQVDGHNYAEKALKAGAAGVVVERDLGLEGQIIVKNSHYAYGIAAANLYGNPSKKLKLIGVTGTNGKTTITYIVKGILESLGKKVGLIGTIENVIGGISLQATHTTPDPMQLQALFARMVKAGCEYVVMEVSSHALHQERLAGCRFISAGFTNLTQDHLDYHGTMEEYFKAKKRLFAMSDFAVVNLDDKYGARLSGEIHISQLTFSLGEQNADIQADSISFSEEGSRFKIKYKDEYADAKFIQPGGFSVSNALTAVGLCLGAGLDFKSVVKGLINCPAIPGRFEIIPAGKDFTIIRDFAHSTDSLEKLLLTVREFAKGRIVMLFGCAGERDRAKRKYMAAAVAKYADIAILAPDNPRSEPVEQIQGDAKIGFEDFDTPNKVFYDRYKAIIWALDYCKKGDYLILAGKGHEDYQVLNFGTINFNEREIVLELTGN